MRRVGLRQALAAAAVSMVLAQAALAEGTASMLTIVTAGDAQTQGMALVLSLQAAQSGTPVRVLLCGPGGDLALKDAAAAVALKPRNVTPQQMLGQLLAKGARVDVCALYLPNAEKDASALLDGIGVAKPPEVAAALVDPAVRVMTF